MRVCFSCSFYICSQVVWSIFSNVRHSVLLFLWHWYASDHCHLYCFVRVWARQLNSLFQITPLSYWILIPQSFSHKYSPVPKIPFFRFKPLNLLAPWWLCLGLNPFLSVIFQCCFIKSFVSLHNDSRVFY